MSHVLQVNIKRKWHALKFLIPRKRVISLYSLRCTTFTIYKKIFTGSQNIYISLESLSETKFT